MRKCVGQGTPPSNTIRMPIITMLRLEPQFMAYPNLKFIHLFAQQVMPLIITFIWFAFYTPDLQCVSYAHTHTQAHPPHKCKSNEKNKLQSMWQICATSMETRTHIQTKPQFREMRKPNENESYKLLYGIKFHGFLLQMKFITALLMC